MLKDSWTNCIYVVVESWESLELRTLGSNGILENSSLCLILEKAERSILKIKWNAMFSFS